MTARPPLPSSPDSAEASTDPPIGTAGAEPHHASEQPLATSQRSDDEERARMERTARYLKGPTAFSA